MKIHVESDEHSFTIPVPTGLVFSNGSAWLFQLIGRKRTGKSDVEDPDMDLFSFTRRDGSQIPAADLKKLFAEIRRIKKKYGAWELVEVSAGEGARVKITL